MAFELLSEWRYRVMNTYRYTAPEAMQRSTHYGSNYYIIPSRKLGRNVTAFSYLEYCNILTLEMDSEVEYYCEQPCTVDVCVDGIISSTTFDTYVYYKDGREEMQEIKYLDELNSDDKKGERDRSQIEKQRLWCVQNGIGHVVRTDNIIMSGDYKIRNLEWLAAKARRYTMTKAFGRNALISFLKENGSITIGQLYTSGIITTKDGLNLLADMYYRGEIKFKDFNDYQLSNKTEVYL